MPSLDRPAGSTPAPSTQVLYGVQVLRGIAALLVVCRHAAKEVVRNSDSAFAVGQAGVDIFFVISGIVIFLTGRRLTAGDFLRRRIARIVPLYWLVLMLTIIGDGVRGKYNFYTASNVLLSLFFIPARDSAHSMFPPIVVGWTLNFEMFFYLLCALVLATIGGGRLLAAMAAMLLTLTAAGLVLAQLGLFDPHDYPPMIWLLPITLEFLAGMGLAAAFADRRIVPLWACPLLIAAALAWLALAPAAAPYTVWRPLAWGVPAAMIVAAVLGLERHLPFHRWRPLLALGDASYALYLIHEVVLGVVVAIGHRVGLSGVALFAILVGGSIGAGLVMHRLVELPMLRLANRLLGLPRKTSLQGAASADLAGR